MADVPKVGMMEKVVARQQKPFGVGQLFFFHIQSIYLSCFLSIPFF